MLKKLISNDDCAACRFCCIFDRADIWELPVIDNALAKDDALQGCKFGTENSVRKFAPEFDADGLFFCPMLTENGCKLAENKPFDCKLWAFRVMKKRNFYLLTLSPNCPAINRHSVKTVAEFVENQDIAKIAFENARQNPNAINEYIDGYPVFAIEQIVNNTLNC